MESFEKCRLCLSESINFKDLSEVCEGLPLSVIAMIICPIKIEIDDNLPKQICDDCIEILQSAYKLRDTSNQNDRYLRSYGQETQEIEIVEELKFTNDSKDEIQVEEIPLIEIRNEEMIEEDDDNMSKNDDFVLYESGEEVEEDQGVFMIDPNWKYEVVCSNTNTKKSAVWNYMGLLSENDQIIESEKDFYYCKICVEQNKLLKPKYRAESVATSVLFLHLSKVHNMSKDDLLENFNLGSSHQIAELVPCEICEKSVTAGSLQIHTAIEHQNGAKMRICEKESKYKVNCFKTKSKSLAWDYFGVLMNADGSQMDDYYFYCRICVEEEDKLSPKYTKNTSTSILLQHLKNVHVPKSPEELAKRKLPEPINFGNLSKRQKNDDFICKQCGEKCESRKALNRHLLSYHDEAQPRNFTCSVENCGKTFTKRDILVKHNKNVHMSGKFPCNQCPAELSTLMSLRRHIDGCHLKIRSFGCEQCDAVYSELKSLKNHVQKVHLGIIDYKYACEICDMKFPNGWSLRRHHLTHTRERPHQCQVCSNSYASKGDLAKHLVKVHGDSVYKCDQCTAGFRLKTELRDHYKVHYLDEEEEEYEVLSEEFIE